MAISFLPCNDSVKFIGENHSIFSASQNHSENKDACTPFCSCSRCAANAFCQDLEIFRFVKTQFFLKQYPKFNYISIPETDFSIWQPPQLG